MPLEYIAVLCPGSVDMMRLKLSLIDPGIFMGSVSYVFPKATIWKVLSSLLSSHQLSMFEIKSDRATLVFFFFSLLGLTRDKRSKPFYKQNPGCRGE